MYESTTRDIKVVVDPQYLAERHNIQGCEENIRNVAGALTNFAKAATSE